jgi:bifunctional UDP-N-acetylglucosamine pyrophosphorylase/glucosamine-1-phosphate N-acetyltransferase
MRISLNNNQAENTFAIVLAAGMGKRMKSDKPKVLAPISGQPMVVRILKQLGGLNLKSTALVLGHLGNLVKEAVLEHLPSGIIWAEQKEQRGTGDAANCGLMALGDISGTILITAGDTPLLSQTTLASLLKLHAEKNSTVSILSFEAKIPTGYGRIIKDSQDRVLGIREEKDCSEVERTISEVNSGVYAVDSAFLKKALQSLEPKNAQGELYLTDIVEKAVSEGQHVVACKSNNEHEFIGVNDHKQLAEAQEIAMNKKIEELLSSGVRITNPLTVYVEDEVTVGVGSVLGPNIQLLGKTQIGKNVTFEGSAYLIDTIVEDGASIKFGVRAEGAFIGANSSVGPFAHLRPEAKLGKDVKVGNFVEIKKANLGDGAKASHLSYIGDAEVGADANIGAGTITCNYDGYKKSKTLIGAGAFIGSNSSLVAPVEIGEGAIVGAGSVITKNVTKDALVVERSEQREIAGWAKRKRDSQK